MNTNTKCIGVLELAKKELREKHRETEREREREREGGKGVCQAAHHMEWKKSMGALPFAVVRQSIRERITSANAAETSHTCPRGDESGSSSQYQTSDAGVTVPIDVVSLSVNAGGVHEWIGRKTTYTACESDGRHSLPNGEHQQQQPSIGSSYSNQTSSLRQDGVLIPYRSIAARFGIRIGELLELDVVSVAADVPQSTSSKVAGPQSEGQGIFIVRVDGYLDEDATQEQGVAINVRHNPSLREFWCLLRHLSLCLAHTRIDLLMLKIMSSGSVLDVSDKNDNNTMQHIYFYIYIYTTLDGHLLSRYLLTT